MLRHGSWRDKPHQATLNAPISFMYASSRKLEMERKHRGAGLGDDWNTQPALYLEHGARSFNCWAHLFLAIRCSTYGRWDLAKRLSATAELGSISECDVSEWGFNPCLPAPRCRPRASETEYIAHIFAPNCSSLSSVRISSFSDNFETLRR